MKKLMAKMPKDHKPALSLRGRNGELVSVDDQPRGGLLIQIGVVRDSKSQESEWNFAHLTPAKRKKLGEFLLSWDATPKRKS